MSLARFVAATNENDVVPAYLTGRGFHPRASVETISSAMDVGDPSNFRRIVHMFGGVGGGGTGTHKRPQRPERAEGLDRIGSQSPLSAIPRPAESLPSVLTGSSWSDQATRDCIRDLWNRRGVAIDPHTAVGLLGLRRELLRRPGARGVVLATAHPAKFAETVEPLIGQALPVPPGIARVMERPRRSVVIEPALEGLRQVLETMPSPRPRD